MEDTLTAVYRAEIDDFLKGNRKVQSGFSNMRAVSVWSMARVGDSVVNAGRKLISFGADVIKSGQEFESAIASMRAVLPQNDQVGQSFDDLKAKIQELGATTTFTAVEAAEAATFLAMAGLNAAQALEALPSTLQLASAGGLDLGKAADIATNAMSGFGLGAESLQRIVDTLATAAASSNTDVKGLGSAMSFVAATATGLGVSLESTTAGIAALGNVGIQAGRAGRNLSGLFSELAKKGEGLGLNVFKANGELKNLSGILEAVEASGMGTNDIINEFGAITSRTLIALMQTGSEEVAKFEAKFRGSGVTIENVGLIAEAAGVNVESLQSSLEGTTKTQEALGVTTTDTTALLLSLASAGIEGAQAADVVNQGLAQLADGANKANKDIFATNGTLLDFGTVIRELGVDAMSTEQIVATFGEEGAKVIEAMTKEGVNGFSELSDVVKEFAGEAEGAGAAMQHMKTDTLAGDLSLLTSAFDGLKQAITSAGLNEVIRQIVQGITSLVEEATSFVNENKEAIDDFFSSLATKVAPAIAQLKPQVIPVLTAIGESFAEVAERSLRFVGNLLSNKNTLASIFSGISQGATVLRDVLFTLMEAFAAMPAPMQKLVVGAVAISATMGPLLTLVAGFTSGLVALVGAIVPATTAAGGIGAAIAGLLGPVALVTAAIVGLAAAFATNFGGIRDKVKEAWDKILSKFDDGEREFKDFKIALEVLWKSFEQVFELIMDLVIDVVATAITAFVNFSKTVGDVVGIISSLLRGDFTSAWQHARELVSNIVTFWVDLFQDLSITFVNLGENVVKGFGEGVTRAFGVARESITNLGSNIIGWFKGVLGISSPSTVFADFGKFVVQGLVNGIQGMFANARQTVTEFANNVSGWFKSVLRIESPSKEFENSGADIVGGLVSGINKNSAKAVSAAGNLAQNTADKVESVWTEATEEINKELFSVSNALKDISPIASGVVNFVGNVFEQLTEKAEEFGASAITAADALGAIGSAAQGSSSIAVKALGGLASTISNIASGNVVGAVVSGVSTVVGAISGIFNRGKQRAKKFQEQMAKMKKFMQGIADSLSGLDIFGNVGASGIEFNVREILGEDKVLTDLRDFEKTFLDGIFDFRKRAGTALDELSGVLREKFGIFGQIERGAGAEFGERSSSVVGKASKFAGELVAEMVKLEGELSEAFRDGVDGGLQGRLTNELEGVVESLEFWGSEFSRATTGMGNEFDSALSAVFIEGDSLENASKSLRENFNKFILQTIFDLAIKAALANTLIAAKMADLTMLIAEAFESGEWQPAKTAIKSLTRDLDKAFTELANTVGEAVEELDLGVKVAVDPDVAPVDTEANVTVNLDDEGVKELNAGVEKLSVFGDRWAEKVDQFSLSTEQLVGDFIPDLAVINEDFSKHVGAFGRHVGTFGASVTTYETTVNNELLEKGELMTRFVDAIEVLERAADNLAFSDVGKVI